MNKKKKKEIKENKVWIRVLGHEYACAYIGPECAI